MHQEQSVDNLKIRLRDSFAPASEHAEPPEGAQAAPGGFWGALDRLQPILDFLRPYLATLPPGKYQKIAQGLALIFEGIRDAQDGPEPEPAHATKSHKAHKADKD